MTDRPLVDLDEVDSVGDEWEEIDVSDTNEDRIARKRDREFNAFRKRIKDADQFKVQASVFDDATLGALYKLVQDGFINAIGGPVSTGKEANIYEAIGADDREIAIKIYRINASDFRHMRDYLEGDPRFENIGSDRKEVVIAWVRKEYANLKRALDAGIRVPEPLAVERNVLVMEFLGHDAERSKRLGEVAVENPETAFDVLSEYMRRFYNAGLIHGDLSEYNVVVHENQIYVIDLGQAVTLEHPNAGEFLRRDCRNVTNFFNRIGLSVDVDSLYSFVVGETDGL